MNYVTVDDRQPPETAQLLLGLDIPTRIERMLWADEKWDSPMGLVAVEEKTVEEIGGSVLYGRQDRQLTACVANAEVPVLMILGELKERGGYLYLPGSPVKVSFDLVDNWIFEWEMRGVFRKSCPRPETRVHRLASLYQWTQHPEHREVFVRQRKLPNLRELRGRAEVLAALPGIGVKRAATLSGLSEPLTGILTWDEGVWTSHLGSKAAAKKIVKLLEEVPK